MLVTSLTGLMPVPFQAAYSGTKAFLTAFGTALAHELRGTKISVTVFAREASPPSRPPAPASIRCAPGWPRWTRWPSRPGGAAQPRLAVRAGLPEPPRLLPLPLPAARLRDVGAQPRVPQGPRPGRGQRGGEEVKEPAAVSPMQTVGDLRTLVTRRAGLRRKVALLAADPGSPRPSSRTAAPCWSTPTRSRR